MTLGSTTFLVAIAFSIAAALPAAGGSLPDREWAMIRQIAVSCGLTDDETWVLAAIRCHENGRAGIEFGIGGPVSNRHPARRYSDGFKSFYVQGAWAAGTLRRHYAPTGDLDALSRRYCPRNPARWAASVRSICRRLRRECGNALPGERPPVRDISFP